MALIKLLNVGDELIFDLKEMDRVESKEISVTICEKGGRVVVLKLRAHRSIPIRVFKQELVERKEEIVDDLKFH